MTRDRKLSVSVIRKMELGRFENIWRKRKNGGKRKTECEKEENSLRTKIYHLQRRRKNEKEGKKLFGEGKSIVTANQLGEYNAICIFEGWNTGLQVTSHQIQRFL